MVTTLYDLKQNESGIIIKLGSTGKMKQRLIDMGVTTGTKVTMQRKAPFGDPLEFLILGYKLSIRKSEAKKIQIERIKDIGQK